MNVPETITGRAALNSARISDQVAVSVKSNFQPRCDLSGRMRACTMFKSAKVKDETHRDIRIAAGAGDGHSQPRARETTRRRGVMKMQVPQLSKNASGQIVVDSTDIATVLTTDWLLAAGATDLIAWWDQQAMQGVGTFKSKARYRFASVRTDQPGNWTTASTERTGPGQFVEAISISGTTDQMWVQAAIGGYAAGGIAEAFVRMQSQVQGKGVLVATDVIEVEPTTNSGQASYVAIGKRFPQVGITKLMYAYVFKGVSGTITYRPVHREYKGDPDLPGAWTGLGAGDSTATVDGTANSGLLTATTTSGYMYGEAGLKFSGDARGSIRVTVAAVY